MHGPFALDACQVPVFRYALERWPADAYGLAVFHNGPLSKEQQEIIASVDYDVNLEVFTIDVSEMTAPQRIRFGKVEVRKGQALARLYYPVESRQGDDALWEGTLNRQALDRIVDSPVRRKIAKDILAGESAVWVILKSGDPESDALVETNLNKHLQAISKWLEIPEGVAGPGELERVASGEVAMEDVLRSTIPLKISFSAVSISRNDPEEAMFVRMLTGFVPDLIERYPGQPLVFPVFGRGRTLDGISQEMLNDELMASAGSYICGACSCEVKRENPGIDLVMSVEWDEALEGSAVVVDKQLPPLEGVGDLVVSVAQIDPSAVSDEASDEPDVQRDESVSIIGVMGILCAVILIVLTGMTFLLKRRAA
ncbi:MAG: hypothetical protein GY899_09660 [Verrucomicrobiaceae bacterium]|nr:hypothetical protein [Verrucomicrobiaceae bacterium]